MTMRLLSDLFPPSKITTHDAFVGESMHEELMGRNFILLEFFCDNNYCPCTAVDVVIAEVDKHNAIMDKPALASINYDWSVEPGTVKLREDTEQSVYAKHFLWKYKQLLKDPFYLERLRLRNELFKALCKIDELTKNKKVEPLLKFGRNELCHCGSGKKYKKCCLNNINENVPTYLMADKN